MSTQKKFLQVKINFNRETRFILLYILTLLIAFSPIKAMGQFIGIFCLLGLIFFVQVRPKIHLLKYSLLLMVYTALGCFYLLFLPDFSFINYYLFFITASSFLILFYDLRPVMSPSLLNKLSLITLIMIFFQAVYGILQGIVAAARSGSFDIANGDVVRGTIEPGFFPSGLGGNVMFAILISSLLVFTLGASRLRFSWPRIIIYAVCTLAWIIASVLHTILFFGAATLVALLLAKIPRRRKSISKKIRQFKVATVAILLLITVLIPVIIPRNLNTLPNFLSYTLDIREDSYSEKSRATYILLFHLSEENPYQPIIGLGPGQYSSRAALILTGQYIRGSSIPLPNYTSTATGKHILPLWASFLSKPGQGSTFFPFSSWLSLYGEAGLLGLLFIFVLTLTLSFNLRRWNSPHFPGINLSLLILIFYILFLGFQDNYWEFTQAIFPAFFTLSIGYNYLRSEARLQRVLEQPAKSVSQRSILDTDVAPQT